MSALLRTQRLTSGDRDMARALFALMAEVFGEECAHLSDSYMDSLLGRRDFWAVAALAGDELVGGVTAHTLPLTIRESSELFIYDIAVRADHQRQGVGRQLVAVLREAATVAGATAVFVAADNDDGHALDFYRALGGAPSAVTFFTFSRDPA